MQRHLIAAALSLALLAGAPSAHGQTIDALGAAGGVNNTDVFPSCQPTCTVANPAKKITALLLSSYVFAKVHGDFTIAADGTVTLGSGIIYSRIQNVAASRLLGNPTGSAAAMSEISLDASLAFAGTTLGIASPLPNNKLTGVQNAVKGAATSAVETDLAVPSCSTGTSALTWTTNTGFGCNSISIGSVVTSIAGNTGAFTLGAGLSNATNVIQSNNSGVNLAARFGSMDVWQRGAGGAASIAVPASTTAYTVDGCYLATGTNQASTVAAVAGIAPGSFKAAAVTRNSGQTGTGFLQLGCPFDSDEIALFAGQFVTLSFTASTGANWSPASGLLNFILYCGTGTPKKDVTGFTGEVRPINATQNIAAGTAAARYQATSASIVPANCTQAEINFSFQPVGTAGAADTVTIDDVQLEVVPNATAVATPYQRQDFEYQLNKAQRHYAKTFPYGTAAAQNGGVAGSLEIYSQGAGINLLLMWLFPRPMRIVNPAITTYNPAVANANCRDVTGSADVTATIDPEAIRSESHVGIKCGVVTGANAVIVHVTADAGI